MSRYRVVESVGARREPVRRYDDLEIHHPSQRGREPGRHYGEVRGRREEVLALRTRGGQRLVSKDFILLDERGGTRVPVPSPVEGVVGAIDAANGRVDLYDRRGGELLVRLRHLDLRGSGLRTGDRVGYGQPLGMQSGVGAGDRQRYGTHVHVDFNEAHLDRFDRYLRELDAGVLTSDGAAPRLDPRAVLGAGSRGPAVYALQRALAARGYGADARGPLPADGDFGPRTEAAVRAFQRDAGLRPDGRAGRRTRDALWRAGPA